MPLHLTVRTKGPAPGQGQTSEHAAVTEGEPDASDAALCRLRRQAASLLRERFELDPQRYAEEGMEAVLHLLRSGEREDALELLRHIGQKLATAPSVVVHREPIRSTAAAPAKKQDSLIERSYYFVTYRKACCPCDLREREGLLRKLFRERYFLCAWLAAELRAGRAGSLRYQCRFRADEAAIRVRPGAA